MKSAVSTKTWHFGTFFYFQVGMVRFANVFVRQYRLAESLGLLPRVFFWWLPYNQRKCDRIQKNNLQGRKPLEAMSKDILIVD
ncbi:hypothetical protein A6770_05510 [Nostoc minutum NIES-26]|uniref:Uncharacterized protein n=1 Tax=Nostoc minutum NIES-26 TaxID=1844469 RepID=A0A367Q746_9NOSO|nr:hypothetical protein [Dendronalium sp. ChiSLP03b]MDZ8207671.1 hypothetical protein [Dendronalium sp. ChiSLP03b]RCJ19600.1 hypothetical protein A6770_05510 [Nostoc minutum NIES-26]